MRYCVCAFLSQAKQFSCHESERNDGIQLPLHSAHEQQLWPDEPAGSSLQHGTQHGEQLDR